jgi:CRISPR-associated protein Csx14
MRDYAIPVDLRNPGQVFACLGFAEAVEHLTKTRCESRFDCPGSATIGHFVLTIDSDINPFGQVIDFLRTARVWTRIPATSDLSTKKWSVPDRFGEAGIFPNSPPKTPATLPVMLATDHDSIVLDHWADGPHCGRDNVKFWAGSGGYPGSALARDIIQSIKASDLDACIADPFSASALMTSSFRFDFRRDYIPLDAGFSPNSHGNVLMVGYPLTEMLAVFGLQYARPTRISPRDKLKYRYGIWETPLPLSFARVLLGGTDIGFPMRTFKMTLGWPGQVGQARCITDSQEDF